MINRVAIFSLCLALLVHFGPTEALGQQTIGARTGGQLALEPTPDDETESAENVLNISNIFERGYAIRTTLYGTACPHPPAPTNRGEVQSAVRLRRRRSSRCGRRVCRS